MILIKSVSLIGLKYCKPDFSLKICKIPNKYDSTMLYFTTEKQKCMFVGNLIC